MTPSEALAACVTLLERLRDTYLSNHQTEREVISSVIRDAKESDEEFQPLNVKKKVKSK